MFGMYDTLDYREHWNPVRLRTTVVDEGWLIPGPFASDAAALNVLNRLPKLLPKESWPMRGVQPGVTGYPMTWQTGIYTLDGVKSNLPMSKQAPTIIHKPGVLDAIVVEKNEGASGHGITVESQGRQYSIYMGGNMGGVKTIIGDCETPGNRVRIWYKSARPNDGSSSLDVYKIQQIKKR